MKNDTFSFWWSASATVSPISTKLYIFFRLLNTGENDHPPMFHTATVRLKRLEPGLLYNTTLRSIEIFPQCLLSQIYFYHYSRTQSGAVLHSMTNKMLYLQSACLIIRPYTLKNLKWTGMANAILSENICDLLLVWNVFSTLTKEGNFTLIG